MGITRSTLFTLIEDMGFSYKIANISKDELKTFEKNDTNLLGHPVINRSLGIDFSNGSLGMGLSLGIGVAISSKKKN